MNGLTKKDSVNLSKDNIYKLFFYFFIPNLCAMLTLSTDSTIDGIFVGNKLGNDALAAVGICWPVFPAIIAFELLFGMGAASIASYFLGKGSDNRARLMFSSVFYFACVSSIIISVFLLIFIDSVANLLGANESIKYLVIEYLQVIFAGTIIMVLHPLLDIFVINDKRPILAMMAMIIGSVSNIILNYLFLFVFEMGIFGSALATVLGHSIGMCILLSHFLSKKGRIYLIFRFNLNAVLASAKNGIPQSISELSVAFVMVLFNHTLKSLGDTESAKVDYLATYSVIMYVGIICWTMILSCAQGIQPISSFNYGANNMQRVRRIYLFGIIFATFLGICSYVLCISIDAYLVKLFIKQGQEHILDSTLEAMSIYFLGYILLGINIVSAIFFQSIQRPISSFIITISYNLIFISILLYVFSYFYGLDGVWYSYPVSLLCSSVVVGIVVFYEAKLGTLKSRI